MPRKKIETVELPSEDDVCGGAADFIRCAPQDGQPCCGSPESIEENQVFLTVASGEPLNGSLTIDVDDIHCACAHPDDDFEDLSDKALLRVLGPLLDEIDDRGMDLNDYDEYVHSDKSRKETRATKTTMNDLLDLVKLVEAKKSILERAQEIVNGPRRKSYGHPLPNHEAIARLWQAFLDNKAGFNPGPLSGQEVALMMTLLKMARLQFEPGHEDSLLDMAGYVGCVEIMNDRQAEQ